MNHGNRAPAPSEVKAAQLSAEAQEKRRIQEGKLYQLLSSPSGQELIDHLTSHYTTDGPVFTSSCPIQAAIQEGKRLVVNYLKQKSKPNDNATITTV